MFTWDLARITPYPSEPKGLKPGFITSSNFVCLVQLSKLYREKHIRFELVVKPGFKPFGPLGWSRVCNPIGFY